MRHAAALFASIVICAFTPSCGPVHACRDGTVFLTVHLDGGAEHADTLAIAVHIGGSIVCHRLSHHAGASEGTVEITFPDGYSAGDALTMEVVALAADKVLGSAHGAMDRLAAGCDSLSLAIADIPYGRACASDADCVGARCHGGSCAARGVSFSASSVVAGKTPSSILASDLDGDGHADLAVANHDDQSVSVLRGDGCGGFGAAATVPAGKLPSELVAGDVDGDGRADLVVANAGEPSISVLLGTMNGGFSPSASLALDRDGSALALGDFNGDGHLDLLGAEYGDGAGAALSLRMGSPGGLFAMPSQIATGAGPVGLALADLDGDRQLDFVVTAKGASTWQPFYGRGAGAFDPEAATSTAQPPGRLLARDLDGDGRSDLAVLTTSSMVVYANAGGRRFEAPAAPLDANGAPGWIALGDLDLDGRDDLIVTSASGAISYFLNDGSGKFEAAQRLILPTLHELRGVAAGDWNGDGHTDLAVAYGESSVAILFNTSR